MRCGGQECLVAAVGLAACERTRRGENEAPSLRHRRDHVETFEDAASAPITTATFAGTKSGGRSLPSSTAPSPSAAHQMSQPSTRSADTHDATLSKRCSVNQPSAPFATDFVSRFGRFLTGCKGGATVQTCCTPNASAHLCAAASLCGSVILSRTNNNDLVRLRRTRSQRMTRGGHWLVAAVCSACIVCLLYAAFASKACAAFCRESSANDHYDSYG